MFAQTRRKTGAPEYPQLSHIWKIAYISKQFPDFILSHYARIIFECLSAIAQSSLTRPPASNIQFLCYSHAPERFKSTLYFGRYLVFNYLTCKGCENISASIQPSVASATQHSQQAATHSPSCQSPPCLMYLICKYPFRSEAKAPFTRFKGSP